MHALAHALCVHPRRSRVRSTQEAGRLTSANPADWARESFSLGVKFTYDLDPGTVVTDNYVANARALCREQVAVGGYRLAQLLETHTALWR